MGVLVQLNDRAYYTLGSECRCSEMTLYILNTLNTLPVEGCRGRRGWTWKRDLLEMVGV